MHYIWFLPLSFWNISKKMFGWRLPKVHETLSRTQVSHLLYTICFFWKNINSKLDIWSSWYFNVQSWNNFLCWASYYFLMLLVIFCSKFSSHAVIIVVSFSRLVMIEPQLKGTSWKVFCFLKPLTSGVHKKVIRWCMIWKTHLESWCGFLPVISQ